MRANQDWAELSPETSFLFCSQAETQLAPITSAALGELIQFQSRERADAFDQVGFWFFKVAALR
jgi:hypothetical protein